MKCKFFHRNVFVYEWLVSKLRILISKTVYKMLELYQLCLQVAHCSFQ